ncbi:GT2 family glycosyltransferase [Paenibacillus forsythiae]|uniref:GT2 family glycosyltransferase n=1 Tax=Paenibacillus forsythiae TaxID=365616 RepID=A0ABU3HB93_9BACL|nr:glycosyltransferase [Paenibacillus forsythiae]MDT3428000.1 GT2 family glycosyltransferase [Paenibacillus forsythiae]
MNNIVKESESNVSIIIPVYNQCQYTLNCISMVEKNSKNINYEIILVDDCSQDQTSEIIRKMNIKYIRNEVNEGFIKSCNKGASYASGEYLIFLNNDTEVQPGWLEALLGTFKRFEDAGIVGSKLIFGDGTLQEAGGIVWSDGSAWNYGRGENPNDWKYNYVREVDYVTGACISIKKDLFKQCGGFSELYLPAYYEDTDLCFEVRKRGYRIYYQPKSEVVHYEGVTSGVDLTDGVKKYQIINGEKFFEKWKNVLQEKHWHRDMDLMLRAKSHGSRAEVLIVDHKVPEEDKDAGSVRMLNIILLFLNKGFRVTFYSDTTPNEEYSEYFKKIGVEIIFCNEDFESFIKARSLQFDLVWLARPNVSLFKLDVVRKWIPNVKIVYDTIDLYYLRTQRQSEIENNKELENSAQLYLIEESYLARQADYTITVTEDERKRLNEIDPSINTFVIPTIHGDEDAKLIPYEDREGIMFLGGYQHSPNVDAVTWFAQEVLPLIRNKLKGIVFYILGSNPTSEVLALQKDGEVEVVGWVKNIRPWFEKTRVFVSPLRYGAGMKGKNGQSMSYGLPIVTTTIGAEGMNMAQGQHALIADTAQQFAESVINLYQSKEVWTRISTESKKLVSDCYSPHRAKEMLNKLLDLLFEGKTGISDIIRPDIQRLRSTLLQKGDVINKRKKWLLDSLNFENGREVYIWGSGSGGKRTLQMLKEFGIEVKGFIDSDFTKEGFLLNGLIIQSPQYLLQQKERNPFIVIGSMYRKEIERDLYNMGFDLHGDVWANSVL